MKGRILNIKKTTILRLSFIFIFCIFIFLSTLSIIKGQEEYFFYIFCLLLGGHLLIKSALFKLDSSCFFGCVLMFVGSFYFYCELFALQNFYIVFIIISFSIASLLTYCFFDSVILLSIALSTYFASIFTFLLLINVITLVFFLAFMVGIVLLLVIKMFVFI